MKCKQGSAGTLGLYGHGLAAASIKCKNQAMPVASSVRKPAANVSTKHTSTGADMLTPEASSVQVCSLANVRLASMNALLVNAQSSTDYSSPM